MTGPLWEALPDGWMAGQVKHAATVTLGKMLQGKGSVRVTPTTLDTPLVWLWPVTGGNEG